MPKDPIASLADYIEHRLGRGPRTPRAVAGAGGRGLRPENADPITELTGVTTMRVFCCDFDTVDGTQAIVR